MTPAERQAARAQAADLSRVLDADGLRRLGGDAALVAASALPTLTALLAPEVPMDPQYRTLGVARFPGRRPKDLYADPLPLADRLDEAAHPDRVPLFDRTPAQDNGPARLGHLVVPGDALADLIETLGGGPVGDEPDHPRQCSLRLETIGEDTCLLLIIRFVPYLLTVWRSDEDHQHTAGVIIFRSGLRAAVVGLHPAWPRTYRVRDGARAGFERHFTVTAWGDPVHPAPAQETTHAGKDSQDLAQEVDDEHPDQEGDAV